MAGKVSDESPLGQALLSKSAGQEVVVEGPEMTTTYVIESIN